jgi:four helix bundle protein
MNPKIKTYRDLLVWQKSMKLVTHIYQTTKLFPKDEQYGLSAQLRRCAVSVPSNIAEGFGRNGTSEFIRFLQISISSLFEAQTQLEIALNLEYIQNEKFKVLFELTREIERMLSSLMKQLTEKVVC